MTISANDIVDGNPKLTLALIWAIIQYWQDKDVLKSAVPNSQQASMEKFLLNWCQQQTKEFVVIFSSFVSSIVSFFRYKGVEINDFTRSWQNGLAFNALMHKFRPNLFNYDDLLRQEASKNLEHAFNLGKNVFHIDRYLDVEGKKCKTRESSLINNRSIRCSVGISR